MSDDQRYVPSEEDLEAVERMREIRRLMSLIAAGMVLVSAVLLGIQRSRRSDPSQTHKTSTPAATSPSGRHSDKP